MVATGVSDEGGKWLKYNTDYIMDLYKEVECKKRVYRNAKEFVDDRYTLDALLDEINDKERVLAYIVKVRNKSIEALSKDG